MNYSDLNPVYELVKREFAPVYQQWALLYRQWVELSLEAKGFFKGDALSTYLVKISLVDEQNQQVRLVHPVWKDNTIHDVLSDTSPVRVSERGDATVVRLSEPGISTMGDSVVLTPTDTGFNEIRMLFKNLDGIGDALDPFIEMIDDGVVVLNKDSLAALKQRIDDAAKQVNSHVNTLQTAAFPMPYYLYDIQDVEMMRKMMLVEAIYLDKYGHTFRTIDGLADLVNEQIQLHWDEQQMAQAIYGNTQTATLKP